jgi:hypothetical protein
LVQKNAAYRRGFLSRLDSNNPLVAEPETENGKARAGCSACRPGYWEIQALELKASKHGASDN